MASRTTMNISVTPELEAFVKGLVESGQYQSASEVFRAGLRELREKERLRQLDEYVLHRTQPDPRIVPDSHLKAVDERWRNLIAEAIEADDRDDCIDGDEYFARLRMRLGMPERAGSEAVAKEVGQKVG